jgi:hypothetical protein
MQKKTYYKHNVKHYIHASTTQITSIVWSLHLSIARSLHLSIARSLHLSIVWSLHLSIARSLHLSIARSLHLSIVSFALCHDNHLIDVII